MSSVRFDYSRTRKWLPIIACILNFMVWSFMTVAMIQDNKLPLAISIGVAPSILAIVLLLFWIINFPMIEVSDVGLSYGFVSARKSIPWKYFKKEIRRREYYDPTCNMNVLRFTIDWKMGAKGGRVTFDSTLKEHSELISILQKRIPLDSMHQPG